jgi:serine-type D-Ala-D-Ala carboxypeptidase (penicillin-binding protein 5/6)
MRRAFFPAAVLAALFSLLVAPVQASTREAAPSVPPLHVSAEAWYLVGEDGSVLARRNAGERRAVASITKLMTAVVTLEHASLSEIVTVPARSSRVGGSTAFLSGGERLPVSSLLRSMLVASANDAAETLAIHVGRGSLARFVELMNEKADVLGLDDTTFVNPHGLDESGHLSSAEDATALIRYALGISFIRDALDRTSIVVPSGREIPTTDDLLQSWPALIGGKTGHTEHAGWSQAAAARAGGVTVYGAVLGADSRTDRNEALQDLLSYGLARYRRIVAIDAARVYAEAESGWDRPSVELVAPRTVLRTVRERTALVEHVVAPGTVDLPIRRGQRLGWVEIYDGKRLIASSKLIAAEGVSEPGLFGKAGWYAGRTASNVWGLVT